MEGRLSSQSVHMRSLGDIDDELEERERERDTKERERDAVLRKKERLKEEVRAGAKGGAARG